MHIDLNALLQRRIQFWFGAIADGMDRAIEHGKLSAETWLGPWTDVGTPERLASLNQTA